MVQLSVRPETIFYPGLYQVFTNIDKTASVEDKGKRQVRQDVFKKLRPNCCLLSIKMLNTEEAANYQLQFCSVYRLLEENGSVNSVCVYVCVWEESEMVCMGSPVFILW